MVMKYRGSAAVHLFSF